MSLPTFDRLLGLLPSRPRFCSGAMSSQALFLLGYYFFSGTMPIPTAWVWTALI